LGVSFYEVLTLTWPFVRDTDLAILNAVLSGQYVPLRKLRPDLPNEIEAIVTKAMAHDVADRYETCADMASDIERFIGAMTSGSGGTALSGFMKGFFGEERVSSKLRIDSLEALAASGVDVPGMANPHSPKTDPGTSLRADREIKTPTVAPPSLKASPKNPKPRLAVAAGVVAGIAIVGGATLGVVRLLKPNELPIPVADAGMAPASVDSGMSTAEPVVDAGQTVVEPIIDAGTTKTVRQPVVLSGAMVTRALGANNAKLQNCLTKYKAQLPTGKGKIVVNITIPSSGKVSEVLTDVSGTPLGTCLENVVKAIRFPAHIDAAVRVPVPLNFDNSGQ